MAVPIPVPLGDGSSPDGFVRWLRMAIEPKAFPNEPHAPGATTPPRPLTHDGIARLFDDHMERMYAFVARRIEDRSRAEEVTTAAFRRALEVRQSGTVDESALPSFLFRVAASAVIDHARRQRREIPMDVRAADLDEGDDAAIAEEESDEAATRAFAAAIDGQRLRRAVLALPDSHRRVLLLTYFDALDPSESGAALRCPTGDVPLRVHRALRALNAALTEEGADVA